MPWRTKGTRNGPQAGAAMAECQSASRAAAVTKLWVRSARPCQSTAIAARGLRAIRAAKWGHTRPDEASGGGTRAAPPGNAEPHAENGRAPSWKSRWTRWTGGASAGRASAALRSSTRSCGASRAGWESPVNAGAASEKSRSGAGRSLCAPAGSEDRVRRGAQMAEG